jgi:hypothetical protein
MPLQGPWRPLDALQRSAAPSKVDFHNFANDLAGHMRTVER